MRIRTLALACLVAAALAACERAAETPAPQASTELDWTRAALERNPNLEVIATDAEAGVFTVRDRASGEVQTVKASDLAAAPVAQLSRAPAPRPAMDEPVPSPEEPAAAEPSTTDGEELDYTVERQGGQVRVKGPGISIVSAGTPAPAAPAPDAGQRKSDPYICEGQQMLRFDNRRILVDGDAVTARNGCELHITNSTIVASGTGVVVRDATVHITNSTIEGAHAAYEAGPGAKLFLRGATLNGVLRRDPSAEVQELGY
jgi:hypothetical protein